jgi:hypothetical protein
MISLHEGWAVGLLVALALGQAAVVFLDAGVEVEEGTEDVAFLAGVVGFEAEGMAVADEADMLYSLSTVLA